MYYAVKKVINSNPEAKEVKFHAKRLLYPSGAV